MLDKLKVSATIVGIASTTVMTFADTDALDTGTISGASYVVHDCPIYLDEDPIRTNLTNAEKITRVEFTVLPQTHQTELTLLTLVG